MNGRHAHGTRFACRAGLVRYACASASSGLSIPRDPVSASLLRLLLCVILVLNGIGSAAASARVADAHTRSVAPKQMLGETIPDCPHAAAVESRGHAPLPDPSMSQDHAGHENNECLELCLEQCLNQGPAMVTLQAGLPSMDAAPALALHDDLGSPSLRPALPIRPPIA